MKKIVMSFGYDLIEYPLRMVMHLLILGDVCMSEVHKEERSHDFICISAVHIISFFDSFLSWVDELNKLAGSPCIGLYSSAGRALQCKHSSRGHGFESC